MQQLKQLSASILHPTLAHSFSAAYLLLATAVQGSEMSIPTLSTLKL